MVTYTRTIFCSVALIACADNSGQEVGMEFGPASAENEIRQRFEITGSDAEIDEIHRVAQRNNIRWESMPYDHSLRYCSLASEVRQFAEFEMFYYGLSDAGDSTLNYVVVYDSLGQVLCIETRHAYRG